MEKSNAESVFTCFDDAVIYFMIYRASCFCLCDPGG